MDSHADAEELKFNWGRQWRALRQNEIGVVVIRKMSLRQF
jgi:hypothetical protein